MWAGSRDNKQTTMLTSASEQTLRLHALQSPVVASDFPETRKVVAETEFRVPVDSTDPNAIAEAIIYLLEHPDEARKMGENGRRAVLGRYNWGEIEGRLLRTYLSLNGSGMA